MLRMAWLSLAIAITTGIGGFAVVVDGAPLAPLQFPAFLFAVLFLILLILGTPRLRSFV